MKELVEKSFGDCPLCGREMIKNKNIDKHHLIPKCKGGKKTQFLHRICHQKLHSYFTENELATEYYDIDNIIKHPEIVKFIKWIQKKQIDFLQVNKESNFKKKKK